VTAPYVEADPYVEKIRTARVYDVAIRSPLDEAARLSRRLANRVLLKREDLQPVFSFKLRGAYNKIAQLADLHAQRGVICASAGNHAQGVALAAQRRGIKAVVVMPLTTPQTSHTHPVPTIVMLVSGKVMSDGPDKQAKVNAPAAVGLKQLDQPGQWVLVPAGDTHHLVRLGTSDARLVEIEVR